MTVQDFMARHVEDHGDNQPIIPAEEIYLQKTVSYVSAA